MPLQTLFQILDRYGFPTFACVAGVWLLAMFIRGPLTVFARDIAQPIRQLVQVAIDFLARAGATLGQLPGQVAAEGQATRAAVTTAAVEIRAAITTEGASIREHMTGIAGTAVTVVHLAEPASAPAPASKASASPPPLPEPRAAQPTVPDRPREPLVTLPSIEAAPA